jgi:hypothetical protein
VKMSLGILRSVLLFLALSQPVLANPAPAPLLQSPSPGATNVDPDPTLTWRWIDDLMSNGSFESGLSPGWYAGGPNPTIWQVYTDTTNRYGMGYRWATTYMTNVSAMGQIIQDIYVPADAASATLQWSERVWNLLPTQLLGRFRVWLAQGGVAVLLLEDATGSEPVFMPHNWVSRSTNLLAYAGQSFQLIVQADSYSPLAPMNWFADVDGFTFACEHFTSTPEFQVYVGKSSSLRSTNQVGDTTGLSFGSVPLASSTTYYWRVAAVRDSVTNYSTTAPFRTGQRVLPTLTLTGQTATGVRMSFPTHINRYYTIEQSDSVGDGAYWYDVVSAGLGTGAPIEVEVPWSGNDATFWRLRVNP